MYMLYIVHIQDVSYSVCTRHSVIFTHRIFTRFFLRMCIRVITCYIVVRDVGVYIYKYQLKTFGIKTIAGRRK